ncbi:MAG: hypothetical protein A2X52_05885 [Candidatus Rokubacteria bacterium GWC2_70_16]|nr:MAG: hypothetical protein A2X52_05885 [Candidatus Rokubacteria bacterium GWC2_70_16]
MDARFLRGRVHLARRETTLAIQELQTVLKAEPRLAPARLLGTAYLGKREPAKATEAYRRLVALAPRDPRGAYLVGLGLLAQGKRAEARKELEAALALAPGFVEPLAQLVSLSFAESQPETALARAQKQIARVPDSGVHQYLLGRVHLARRDPRAAEGGLLKAVEMEPRLVGPYVQLGNLYAVSGQYDQALGRLEDALKINPRDLAALMLSGVIHQRKGNVVRAQQSYERALAVNPRFAPAANNLAWVLSEHGGDKEPALQLAQMAKEVAPDDPEASDTLGWMLFKRGVHHRALALIKESASKLPDNPQVQYHLGMALAQVGDRDNARRALRQAVQAPAAFPGQDEARRALAQLN